MSQKILIVDDEPSIVIPLKFLMEQKGYEVEVAVSGAEVLERMESFRPDLVLLDIMLPGTDGLEVCQSIRENPSHSSVKIVFITALGRDMDVAKGVASGGDAYITKPFANADLLETVKKLLR